MRKVEVRRLRDISEEDLGKLLLVEATVEVVYPIKEDLLKHYILVDSSSPIQRAIYLEMNSTSRRYLIGDGYVSFPLINAPLSFYEGQRIRIIAKLVKRNNRLVLKFKKLV